MLALARSDVRGPTREVVHVIALLMLPAMLAQLYLDTLSVDVHVADTYMVVANHHYQVLLIVALGGPLALRHSFAERYERWPSWLVRGLPWMSGGALLWLVTTLGYLGHQGLPRRYYAYLPEYLLGHRIAGVAATLLCLATLTEALVWLGGRRR